MRISFETGRTWHQLRRRHWSRPSIQGSRDWSATFKVDGEQEQQTSSSESSPSYVRYTDLMPLHNTYWWGDSRPLDNQRRTNFNISNTLVTDSNKPFIASRHGEAFADSNEAEFFPKAFPCLFPWGTGPGGEGVIERIGSWEERRIMGSHSMYMFFIYRKSIETHR